MSVQEESGPETLGPYRLRQRLGEGGMGVVYLATDPAQRLVAVKVLRRGVPGEATARRRLAREFETMRRVHSPNVAEVIAADVESTPPYIVTRYVPGRTVEEVVSQDGPMTGLALLRLARGLASALTAVHAAGVVHRDLKPANVMILDGEPVVIDFGIAQAPDSTRLTMTGMFMGTPGYLAPEVIEGNPSGPAADVHSWAATLAFAATGRPPFGSGTFEAIFYRIINGQPDLGTMPHPLMPLILHALARDPSRRPSAAELAGRAAALDPRALLRAEPPTIPPGGGLPSATRGDMQARPGSPVLAGSSGGANGANGAGGAGGLGLAGGAAVAGGAGLAAAAGLPGGAGGPGAAGGGAGLAAYGAGLANGAGPGGGAAGLGNGAGIAGGGNGAGPGMAAGGAGLRGPEALAAAGQRAPLPAPIAPAAGPPSGTRQLMARAPDNYADLLPPVDYRSGGPGAGQRRGQPPVIQGGVQPSAQAVDRPGSGRKLLVLGVLATAIAGAVVLPVAGTIAAVFFMLALRSVELSTTRLSKRRSRQGPSAADPVTVLAYLPWAAVRSAIRMVLTLPLALIFAAAAAAATFVMVPVHPVGRAEAYAAGAFVACYALGPGSSRTRKPLSRFFGTVTRSTPTAIVVFLGVAAVTVTVVAAALSIPPDFWPSQGRFDPHHLPLLHGLFRHTHFSLSRLVRSLGIWPFG